MSTIEPDAFHGLRAAVEAGTGLAGWHGGIADSYRNTSDYLHLIGGQFACHPGKHPDERIGEQSDNYVRYTVNMLPGAAEHPITAGIGDFDLVTEQYWVLADDYIDVLATTTQPVRAVGPVAPAGHLAGNLDPAVGPRADLRGHARAPRRHPRGAERQHDHQAGNAVGQPLTSAPSGGLTSGAGSVLASSRRPQWSSWLGMRNGARLRAAVFRGDGAEIVRLLTRSTLAGGRTATDRRRPADRTRSGCRRRVAAGRRMRRRTPGSRLGGRRRTGRDAASPLGGRHRSVCCGP